MKIKTQSNKSKIIIAIAVIVFMFGAAGAYAYLRLSHSKTLAQSDGMAQAETQQSGIVNYNPPTDDQQSAGSTTKDQAASQNNSSTSNPSTLNVTLTNTDTRLNALIDTITNTGSCTLTLTGPSAPTPVTVNIQALSSYSACQGFDISSLTPGSWTAKVDVQSGTQTGTATKTFTVEKA